MERKNIFLRNQNPTNPVNSLAPAQVHQPSGSDSPEELWPSWTSWRFSKVSRSDSHPPSISVHLRPGCTWWTHASPVDSPQWWSRSRQLRLRKHGWLVLYIEQWKHFRKMTHVEMEFQSFNSSDIILGLQLFYQSFKWTVNCGSDCWMDVVLHQLIGSFQPHTKRTPEVTSTSGQTKIDKTWWKKCVFYPKISHWIFRSLKSHSSSNVFTISRFLPSPWFDVNFHFEFPDNSAAMITTEVVPSPTSVSWTECRVWQSTKRNPSIVSIQNENAVSTVRQW